MEEFYCGPAPDPQALPAAWNADPIAIGFCLGLAGLLFVRGTGAGGRLPAIAGILILAALYVSPLCALTVALFSGRVLHHVVLIAVAIPFLAMGFPQAAGQRRRPEWISLTVLTVLHALIVWLWHAPALYDFAIRSTLPYWTMQLSFAGSGFLLWRRILAADTGTGAAVLALLATSVQMGMLGALLVFAREPLYLAHSHTTLSFGMTPLADQQLAGLIMWVPAALPYLLAAIFLIASRLAAPPARAGWQ